MQRSLKECVIAHWSSDRARIIYRGSSLEPKLRTVLIWMVVGERCQRSEVVS